MHSLCLFFRVEEMLFQLFNISEAKSPFKAHACAAILFLNKGRELRKEYICLLMRVIEMAKSSHTPTLRQAAMLLLALSSGQHNHTLFLSLRVVPLSTACSARLPLR